MMDEVYCNVCDKHEIDNKIMIYNDYTSDNDQFHKQCGDLDQTDD